MWTFASRTPLPIIVEGYGPKTPNLKLLRDFVSSGRVKGEGKKAADPGDPKKGSERSPQQISYLLR